MARYVGAAVAVAAVAMIYNAVANEPPQAGESAADALAAGLGGLVAAMAVWSAAGRRCSSAPARASKRARAIDRAAAAAITMHTDPRPEPRSRRADDDRRSRHAG